MKVIIWIEKDQITNLLKGESVEYWEREPGMFEKTIPSSNRFRLHIKNYKMIDQIQPSKLLFIDIETCGSYATLEELEDKNNVLNNLWNKMGDSYFRRHYPEDERMSDGELFKKYSGLLPEFGRVVCVSAGFITGEERKIQSFTKGGEEDILKETVNLLNRVNKLGFSLCGHNIKTFDLPYLGKRMLINKIKPSPIMPSYNTKPWENKSFRH